MNSTIEGGFKRIAGTDGVFATSLLTGAASGVAHASAPELNVPPLAADEATHNDRVLEYFTTAGLPADQVAGVQGLLAGSVTNSSFSGAGMVTSTLSRSVEGNAGQGGIAGAKVRACPTFEVSFISTLEARHNELDGGVFPAEAEGAQCRTEYFWLACGPGLPANSADYGDCTCYSGHWECQISTRIKAPFAGWALGERRALRRPAHETPRPMMRRTDSLRSFMQSDGGRACRASDHDPTANRPEAARYA